MKLFLSVRDILVHQYKPNLNFTLFASQVFQCIRSLLVQGFSLLYIPVPAKNFVFSLYLGHNLFICGMCHDPTNQALNFTQLVFPQPLIQCSSPVISLRFLLGPCISLFLPLIFPTPLLVHLLLLLQSLLSGGAIITSPLDTLSEIYLNPQESSRLQRTFLELVPDVNQCSAANSPKLFNNVRFQPQMAVLPWSFLQLACQCWA